MLRRGLRELLTVTTPLQALGTAAAGCTRCRLANGRTQVVFGVGDPHAELMLVGEAPGFHEDRQGEPFVGRSGQLLDRMLRGIGLSRDSVYITNVVLCRPPGNRDPQPDEIDACRGYLDEQIRLVDPKVVLTLGNFASKTLLETTTGITRLRGRTYPFQGRTLVPTFHPAAALRSERYPDSGAMRGLQEDFGTVAGLLEQLRRPGPAGAPAAPSVPVPTATATSGAPPAAAPGPPPAAAGGAPAAPAAAPQADASATDEPEQLDLFEA
jgi:uracil-DNA glycosylase family 4